MTMTNQEKINLIGVLSQGYAKPDLSTDCCTSPRTVYETKDYRPYIMAILNNLLEESQIEKTRR